MRTRFAIHAVLVAAMSCLALLSGESCGMALAEGVQASSSARQAEKSEMKKELRILFIGNSYTSVNNLPRLVTALLAEDGRKVTTGEFLAGGMSFRQHWSQNLGDDATASKDPNAAAKNKSRKGQLDKLLAEKDSWDFAVLQGQSLETLTPTWETAKYAGLLVEKILQANPKTQPIFYQTWARQHQPENQAIISKAYMDLARQHKALIAPAGEAWKAAFAARPTLVLHAADKSHPNPAGTYLTGCVYYAVITGKSPVGLPARIEFTKGKPAFDLSAEDAKFLQEIAWKTVQRVKAELTEPGTK